MRLVMAALLFPATALAGGPSLSISGACPGPMDIVTTGVMPGTNVVIVTGSGIGSAPLPGGPCAGMDSGLSGRLNWYGPLRADGGGVASVSPSIPGPVCSLYAVAVDTATCGVSAPVPFASDLPAECTDYEDLTEPDRHVDWVYDYARCDSWISPSGEWFRFEGDAGRRIPEADPDEYSCGTHAAGWLNGVHPVGIGDTVTVEVCYSWTPGPCWQRNDIQITDCGDFYVYKLYKPLSCSYVYCGEG